MPARCKPSTQKKLEGTDRADRANPNEPKYRAAPPPMPEWLCVAAREEWARVVPLLQQARVLAETDLADLAAYCELYAEVADLSARLSNGERFMTDAAEAAIAAAAGMTLLEARKEGLIGACKYPLAKERRDAIQRLQMLAGELGLSPVSRSKVSSLEGAGDADPMAAPARAPRPARKPAEAPVN